MPLDFIQWLVRSSYQIHVAVFEAGCPIQVQVAWGSCFAAICDYVLFSINVCSCLQQRLC